jgi:L-iditol 2-dehydrogenase
MMKAVLLRSPRDGSGRRSRVEEVGVPRIGPGELLVEMRVCGLCGTDLEKIRGGYTAAMPVLGHEAVGVVDQVGDGVVGLKKGDTVFPHHHVSCGRCYFCRRGSETMCEQYRKTNLDPGGFAEFFRVPRRNVDAGGVLRLPSGLGFEPAAMIEPLACCIRALDRCAVRRGDSVLVAGAGPVGMAHALLLQRMGAQVLVSEVSRTRLKFAEESTDALVVDAKRDDVPRAVKKHTDGKGVDLAIVASGSPRALVQAVGSVRRGGKVCLFGLPEKGSRLDYDISDIFNSEVSVVSSYGATEVETAKALDLIASGKVNAGSLITHKFPLEEFDRAVKASEEGTGMKVLITP